VTQDQLTKISDEIATGKVVEGWGGERYSDRHVLRRLNPDQLWERVLPDGKWEKRPGLNGRNT